MSQILLKKALLINLLRGKVILILLSRMTTLFLRNILATKVCCSIVDRAYVLYIDMKI